MKNRMKDLLTGRRITDIVSVGFIDIENDIAQFCPNLQWLYFEFDKYIIEFEAIEQFSKLKIQFVDSIKYPFEVDEDMIKANSSILDVVLIGSMMLGNDISELCFINIKNDNKAIICDALKLILSNNQIIFLDPSFPFGIAIGGEEQEKFWKNNLDNNYNIEDCVINFK